MPKKKIEYTPELTKLLEHLNNFNPTPLQDRQFKNLKQEERSIYIAARKRKAKADRKKLFNMMKKNTFGRNKL